MYKHIEHLRSKPALTLSDSAANAAKSKEVTFKIEQLAEKAQTRVNYQDSKFASASAHPTKKAYGSLLRRTHLNVFGNVSQRMSVVMSATLADTEVVDSESTVMPVQRKKPATGKLATKLIGMMEEENKRDEREAYQLNSLGPLGDKKIWNFEIFPKV